MNSQRNEEKERERERRKEEEREPREMWASITTCANELRLIIFPDWIEVASVSLSYVFLIDLSICMYHTDENTALILCINNKAVSPQGTIPE
jgi:hypothetical protein